jgi:hypothetical protein
VAVKEITDLAHDIDTDLKEHDRGNGRDAAIKPNSGGFFYTLAVYVFSVLGAEPRGRGRR